MHSIAGVGVAVASSLNDLQQSGLFEDLGGFGSPPVPGGEPDFDLDDDSDFDLPRVTPPDDDELDLESNYSKEKDEHKGVSFRDGVPLFKRTDTVTKS